ncbi:unnamed protein product, partial [Brenthis ino]
MQLVIFAATLLASIVITQAQINADRLDRVNIDEILANKRLLIAYIKCTLDTGRCTSEGRELKSHITEALQKGCDSCTEDQKNSVRKVISHLINNEQDYWKELVQKYDSEGVFSKKYEDELRAL